MYCTVESVRNLIKEDMIDGIIGNEYIEDETEKEQMIAKLTGEAIEDACAEIDGYLNKRYNVPLTKVPGVITKFAKDIAAYNLASRSGIDESDREKTFLTRYQAAIKFLLDVSKGNIEIGIGENSTTQAAANGFKLKSPKRQFSRDSLKGW